ncbi:hypothetical protein [Enterococcus sp. AZ072]|uniref:hypothetical protein n=1 Tax=unclassified Enterococcus TaxID=2608891 RepID=UPI003D2A39A6
MDDQYEDKIHDLLLQQEPVDGYYFVGDWEITDKPEWCGEPNSDPILVDETLSKRSYSDFHTVDALYSSFKGRAAQEILGTGKFVVFTGSLRSDLGEFWELTASLM